MRLALARQAASGHTMKPVWIKYWGVIPMTRRGYLVTLTVGLVVAGIIVAYGAFSGLLPPLRTLWEPDPGIARFGWRGWLYNYFWWLIIVLLLVHAVDMVFVLRKFAQKEAEERAAEAAATPTSVAPATTEHSQTQAKT